MSGRLPTKALQRQREALDAACAELGLSPGVVKPGKKHWKYCAETPAGVATVVMAPSPASVDLCLTKARTRLREQIVHLLERKGALN